ncbi:MAG: IS630 family transposase, partial [Calditrichota bacterium]
KRGHRGHIKLKPWQAALTVRLIQDRLPDQLKLPFFLWTREAVAQLIEKKFGIRLSKMTVGRYLKRWGFTPQVPAKRAFERKPAAVEHWLNVEYPLIQRSCQQEGARIYWGDEMGARSDHQAGRTYGRRGKTPVVPSTGKRFGCNMISAITNRGDLRFMVFRNSFTSDVFIQFLDRLIKSAVTKVYLIVDNHSVHRSKKVKIWLDDETHGGKINIFYLPPYSPDLNPDEYLNNDVKTNAVGRKRARDRDDLESPLRSHLRSAQKRPAKIRNFFKSESVLYAAL